MKPKLRQSVHYAPTKDGVYFKTWTSEFVIKGKGLYQWIESIAPYLKGDKTVDELVGPLSPEQGQFVRNLIDELVRRDVVRDTSKEAQVVIAEAEQALYQQTLQYLEEYAINGRVQFHKFRQFRWLVSGSGLSYRACVRSLIRFGIKTLYLERTEDPIVVRWIEEWKEKDPALQITWIALGEEEGLLRKISGQGQAPELAFYVSDQYDSGRVESLIQLYEKYNVDFIIASKVENRGIVGPVINQAASTAWHSLKERLHRQKEENAFPPTFYLMLGNKVALDAFNYTNGLQERDGAGEVVILTPDRLETKHHILKPSPTCSTAVEKSKEEWLAQFQKLTVEEDQEEFLERIKKLSDSQLGILHPVHPGDLWQIPLLFIMATLHFPRSMKREPVTFVAGRENISNAEEAVVRDALTFYARTFYEYEGGGKLPASVSVWENGRTFDEWLGRGALKAWVQMVKKRVRARVLPPDIPSLKSASYVKMLSLRYGCSVQLIEMELGLPSSHYVMVLDGKQVIAESVGRTQIEAVEKALVKAIGHMQLKNHHSEFLPENLEVWDHPTAAGEWQSEKAIPTWKKWRSLTEPHWKEQGWELVMDPWYRDPACFEAGLLIGRIGFKQGREA